VLFGIASQPVGSFEVGCGVIRYSPTTSAPSCVQSVVLASRSCADPYLGKAPSVVVLQSSPGYRGANTSRARTLVTLLCSARIRRPTTRESRGGPGSRRYGDR